MQPTPFTPLRRITWGVSKHLRSEQTAELAAVVRSALIDRLDDAWSDRLQPLFEEFGLDRGQGIQLMQAIQLALFPEEFAEDEGAKERIKGLVPDGMARIGADRLQAFLEILRSNTPSKN